MHRELSLPERTALLALMLIIKEATNAEVAERVGFRIAKPVRERLVGLGYLTAEQSSAPGKPFVHELTDEGWKRGRAELAAATPERVDKAYRIAFAYTRLIADTMDRMDLRLTDVFTLDAAASTSVEDRLRAAYTAIAGNTAKEVSLRRLREELTDVPREEFDEALLRLRDLPGVQVVPEPDRKSLTDDDRAAAIRIGGQDKHLLSIPPA